MSDHDSDNGRRDDRKAIGPGVGVAVGAGIGTALFAATGEVFWIAIGPGAGLVLGALLAARGRD